MDITLLHRLGSGTLKAFTLHPSGEILAAVGGRGVWLYETSDLSILDHLDGEYTYSAAWSPDGNFLAVREDESIIVWDLASQQISRVLNTNYGAGKNIIWSPDGSMIASSDLEGVISVWGLASGGLIRQLWYEEEIELGLISWSPDKRQIAAAIQYTDSETSAVAIWDIYQRKLIRELRGQEGRITCLSWSPVNHFLATGNEDGSVWIWEPASRQVVTRLQRYKESTAITDLAWSVDGTQIVTAGENGTLTTWKVASNEFTHLTIEEGSTILHISQPTQTKKIFFGLENGRLGSVEINSGAITLTNNHRSELISLAWSPDNKIFAVGGNDHLVELWNTDTWELFTSFKRNNYPIYQLAWSPDQGYLAISFLDSTTDIQQADIRETEPIRTLPGLDSTTEKETINFPAPIAWSPDGLHLAKQLGSNLVEIWQIETGESSLLKSPEQVIKDTNQEIIAQLNTLAWSPDGRLLAGGDNLGNLIIWNITSKEEVLSFPIFKEGIFSVAWSPVGDMLAITGSDGNYELEKIRFWEGVNSQISDEIELNWVSEIRGLAWSPGGRLLAVGYSDIFSNKGMIQIWDIETRNLLIEFEAHNGVISGLAWSPDGKMVASISRDGTIGIWGIALPSP